jgi:hypothetical protein
VSNVFSKTLLVVVAACLIVAALIYPDVFTDKNNIFFKNLVNHNLLGISGLIMSIGISSIVFCLGKIADYEARMEAPKHFKLTRKSLRRDASGLVTVFVLCLLVSVAKPLLIDFQFAVVAANVFSLYLLIAISVLLYDLAALASQIEA